MKKIVGISSIIILLFLFCSGVIADIFTFFAWLFALQYSQPDISIASGIIVRILTFAVSYGLVGVIFNTLGCFESKIMKIVYFIISTLIGFGIAYIVWSIEQHILVIGIVMGVIVLSVIVYWIIKTIIDKKKHIKIKTSDKNSNLED